MPTQRIVEEYPPKSGILIAKKTNPTGTRAYRVDSVITQPLRSLIEKRGATNLAFLSPLPEGLIFRHTIYHV